MSITKDVTYVDINIYDIIIINGFVNMNLFCKLLQTMFF